MILKKLAFFRDFFVGVEVRWLGAVDCCRGVMGDAVQRDGDCHFGLKRVFFFFFFFFFFFLLTKPVCFAHLRTRQNMSEQEKPKAKRGRPKKVVRAVFKTFFFFRLFTVPGDWGQGRDKGC